MRIKYFIPKYTLVLLFFDKETYIEARTESNLFVEKNSEDGGVTIDGKQYFVLPTIGGAATLFAEKQYMIEYENIGTDG